MTSPPARHRFWRWFYDHTAFAYDATLRLANRLRLGSEERIRRQVIAKLPLARESSVLDLGCGTAASRPYLPEDVRYIGMDSSLGMLRRAKTKSARQGWQTSFVQADGQALPFAAHSVELILAMGVLQHVADPAAAIAEALRLAKPDTRLLLIDERHAQTHILQGVNYDKLALETIDEYFILSLQI